MISRWLLLALALGAAGASPTAAASRASSESPRGSPRAAPRIAAEEEAFELTGASLPGDYDALIVGAGPGGAALALELDLQSREAGLPPPRILVLDKRGPEGTRPNFVGMHRKTLAMLARHGIDWKAGDFASLLGEKVRDADTGAWQTTQRFRPREIGPGPAVTSVSDLLRIENPISNAMPIHAIERALREEAAKRPNVEFRWHEGLTDDSPLSREADGTWRVAARGADGAETRYRARFLFGADGADSQLRQKLGIDWGPAQGLENLASTIASGVVAHPGDGWIKRSRGVYLMGGRTSAGANVTVPPGTTFSNAAELERWWRGRLEPLGIPPEAPQAVATTIFDLRLLRASRASAEGTAFLIGDALRTGHPATATFLQAAVRDAARAAQTYVSLAKARSKTERERVVRKYEIAAARATEALQRWSVQMFAFRPDPADDEKWTRFAAATRDDPVEPALAEVLARFTVDPADPPTAVDLGAGGGKDTRAMLARGFAVTAIDQSEGVVRALEAESGPAGRLKTQLADFLRMKLGRASADLVNASYSLPFSPRPAFRGIVWPKIAAAVKPGGYLTGQFFGPEHSWRANPRLSFYSRAEIERLLEGSGFVVERIEERKWRRTHDAYGRPEAEPVDWHVFDVIARKRP